MKASDHMKCLFGIVLAWGLFSSHAGAAEGGKHLFILSGQSNMLGLDPSISFTPTVEKEFGKENVVVVKDAQGGRAIRYWYKRDESAQGKMPERRGGLYVRLMDKVNAQVRSNAFSTVTFVWMQGESDAKEAQGDVYEENLKGLMSQLSSDLGRDDVNFVIGRLSDYGIGGGHPEWVKVREAQMAVADAVPRAAWVDTDGLTDRPAPKGRVNKALHYTPEGYKILGERFAQKAIELIESRAGDYIDVIHNKCFRLNPDGTYVYYGDASYSLKEARPHTDGMTVIKEGKWQVVGSRLTLNPDIEGAGSYTWNPESSVTVGGVHGKLGAWHADKKSTTAPNAFHDFGAWRKLAAKGFEPGPDR